MSASTWVGFAAMCLGMFMAVLDIQMVATSLRPFSEALDIAPDQMSWMQTAYLIAEVIAIPLTGLLTRALTHAWLFVIARQRFSPLASIGCAASDGFATLIAWRMVQGFSGGMLIPLGVLRRVPALSVRAAGACDDLAGMLAVLAPTVGPVVGGWITETYSWHWLFLINVVPGILAAVVAGAFAAARGGAIGRCLRHSTCRRSLSWRWRSRRSRSA